MSRIDPETLSYDEKGLVPVVVQDVATGAVLMLAFANQEAVEMTLSTGQAHFWSRSRKKLWRKGEESGHTLEVVEMRTDCDRDTLLVRARPQGPTCHLGTRTCFEPNPAELELGWLWQVLVERETADPDASYTARLLRSGVDRIARKVGEEGAETIIAAMRAAFGKDRSEVVTEASDLLYHLLVLLRSVGVEPAQVAQELVHRHRQRGAPPDSQ